MCALYVVIFESDFGNDFENDFENVLNGDVYDGVHVYGVHAHQSIVYSHKII